MPDPLGTDLFALQEVLAGRYSILGKLGRGGMGVVALAQDVALERLVAIKLLPSFHAGSASRRERFLREARTAAGLSHPNIVPIFLVEEQGDLVYYVMAYVEGETLRDRVARQGPLALGEGVRIFHEIACALEYAHERRVVHRDIKPENVLLESGSGRALVVDFGIARILEAKALTLPGELIGTPTYASPEQMSGEPVDARSDWYSFGATMFFALTGRPPFQADTVPALLTMQLLESAPPVATLRPDVPSGLAGTVDRCLCKRPEDRVRDAMGLAGELGKLRVAVPEVPLQVTHFCLEVDRTGVELAGYAVWALVIATSPMPAEDWLLSDALVIITAVLVTLSGASLLNRARALSRSGFSFERVKLAFDERAKTRASRPSRPLHRAVRLGLFLAGLAGVVWYWHLNGDNTFWGWPGEDFFHFFFALLPFGLGRLAMGLVLTQPAPGRWWDRLWAGPVGRAVYWIAHLGRKPIAIAVAAARPTEVLVGEAAKATFDALPAKLRLRLADLPDLLGRLEAIARALRQREARVAQALAEVGAFPGGQKADVDRGRRESMKDLEAARYEARDRLRLVVAALENLRLDLLRLQVGRLSLDRLTEELDGVRRLGDEVDRLLAGHSEVEILLSTPTPTSA